MITARPATRSRSAASADADRPVPPAVDAVISRQRRRQERRRRQREQLLIVAVLLALLVITVALLGLQWLDSTSIVTSARDVSFSGGALA